MHKGNEMEIFNELVKREPRLLDKPIEELLPIRYMGQAAVTGFRALVLKLEDLPLTQEQRENTLADGQDAGDMLIDLDDKIGKLLSCIKPEYDRSDVGNKKTPKQLKSKSKYASPADMHRTQQIAKHPEAVKKVKKQARAEKTIATPTAVINEITAQRKKKYDDEHKEEKEKTKLEMTLEQVQYSNAIERAVEIIPRMPPKNWAEKNLSYIKGLWKIIYKRGEVFRDGENESGESRRIGKVAKT